MHKCILTFLGGITISFSIILFNGLLSFGAEVNLNGKTSGFIAKTVGDSSVSRVDKASYCYSGCDPDEIGKVKYSRGIKASSGNFSTELNRDNEGNLSLKETLTLSKSITDKEGIFGVKASVKIPIATVKYEKKVTVPAFKPTNYPVNSKVYSTAFRDTAPTIKTDKPAPSKYLISGDVWKDILSRQKAKSYEIK